MEDDNLTRQVDEVEALSAIYEDEWCTVDESERVYCIKITDGETVPKLIVRLQVIMPTDYPELSPPLYQLNAPWLRGLERITLGQKLEEIYGDNVGENVVFMWVEAIREYLLQRGESAEKDPESYVTKTEENSIPADLFSEDDDISQASNEEYEITVPDLQSPLIIHGDPFTEKRSTFQAHLAPIFYKQQVQMVLTSLCENKKIANATHNIMAYRIHKEDPISVFVQGCDDDGETHAGSRLLHLLQIVDARNVIIIVSRWYGGILLGPDRFKHINNSARTLLGQEGFIKNKDDKKGPKSKKK